MFTRLIAMQRRPDLRPAEFRRHWREVHGPLMAQIPGVRYQQNHVVDTKRSTRDTRGAAEIDGIAQWGFCSDDAQRDAASHPAIAAAGKDLANFVGAMTRMTCEVNVVVPCLATGPMVKQMLVHRAKPGMTAAQFHHRWIDEHAAMVATYPGLLGCRQNIVTGKIALTDPRIADANFEADGVLEMWFADLETMEASLASAQAQKAMKHGAEFLAPVTTYQVEEVRIAP